MPSRFRFRWIPFIAALTAAAVGVALGQWQTRRAHEKEAIEARLTSREAAPPLTLTGARLPLDDAEYRRVEVEGEFVPGWTVYLDNRPYQGMAGFYVLTPLKIAGTGTHVLIARGWVRRDVADRARIPPIATPSGIVRVEGIARRSAGHLLQLGKAEVLQPNAIAQNVEIEDFVQASGLRMQPFILEQVNAMSDGLVRDWPRPSIGVEKHRGYAFQWYALAAMSVVFFLVTGFRRGTN